MKLNPNDLPAHIKAINPHIFRCVGAVEKSVPESTPAQTLDRSNALCQASPQSLVISLLRFGRRKLDSDNLAGGTKPLRDAIAATLGLDDGDPRITWEYGQFQSKGSPGVLVRIEVNC